jgi:crotonobetainyl-CoA:carnitine CoA-transferase CaiB-like acyl-CoA transferase
MDVRLLSHVVGTATMTALEGLRVLDFGRYVAGPYCATLLADFGAEVIRIEKREGSEDRYILPVAEGGEGAHFLQLNRNKQSLTLDPTTPGGREVVRRLVATADIVIVNMTASAVRAMGLDYATLKAIKDDIILVSLSAFGSEGPWKDRLGFDTIGQAMSGVVHLSGQPDQPYRAQVNWVDYSTALHAAFGVMVAIHERRRSGRGQEINASLLASAVTLNNSMLIDQAVLGSDRQAIGNRNFSSAPTDLFRTKDGWIVVHITGDPLFKRWARLMGDEARWMDDPLFANDSARAENSALLSERMADWCGDKTRDEALDILAEAKIPAGPVLTPQETLDHPQVQALGLIHPIDYPGISTPAPVALAPVFLSKTPAQLFCRAPMLGEHSDGILTTLGYDEAAIATLRTAGAI